MWEGNQVWFIWVAARSSLLGSPLYAAAFSGFYLAMFLVLAALILRPVGFQFRGKFEGRMRHVWDTCLVISGIVPSLIFGVAFGNLFVGVPYNFDGDLRFHSTITLLSLLNPFALLAGLVSLAMILLHGASWLNYKASGVVAERARRVMPTAAAIYAILFVAAGFWLIQMDGVRITMIAPNGPSNPLLKTAATVLGAWLFNFYSHPAPWLLPPAALASAWGGKLLRKRPLGAFLVSACVPLFTIATAWERRCFPSCCRRRASRA